MLLILASCTGNDPETTDPHDSGDDPQGATPVRDAFDPPEPIDPDELGFIMLADGLDLTKTGEFYCADAKGSETPVPGVGIQLNTCKVPKDDQGFRTDYPKQGNIYLFDHDLCVTVSKIASGQEMVLEACNDKDPRQKWINSPLGQIQHGGNNKLCWVADAKSEPSAGTHRKREVALGVCETFDIGYTAWTVPGVILGG